MKRIKEQGHMYGVLCIKEQSAWSTVKRVVIDTHQEAAHIALIKKEEIMQQKHQHLNLRWDRIIGAILIVLVLILGAVQAFSENETEVKENRTITVMYRVKEGDTLWSIVKDLLGEEVNAQQVIYQIQQDNNIVNTLPAGRVINIRMPKK